MIRFKPRGAQVFVCLFFVEQKFDQCRSCFLIRLNAAIEFKETSCLVIVILFFNGSYSEKIFFAGFSSENLCGR